MAEHSAVNPDESGL